MERDLTLAGRIVAMVAAIVFLYVCFNVGIYLQRDITLVADVLCFDVRQSDYTMGGD